ncbi:YcxB family protein [Nocardia sp. NPDC057663]|uniref:YcxB family protein n=1 Tax=Nocardia sp. NPDC057663 TaxID=3346201 RepID=UPI00366C89DC
MNPKFTAVAAPGHRMSAHYTHDAMHLQQTTGQVTIRYADFKRVITQGDVVFLQPKGTQGFVVPGEVVPDAALTRLRGALA